MRRERTDLERLTDNAVLLSLWKKAQERSDNAAVGDRLKAMKLAFLATYPLFWDKIKALNLRFYRYTYGPYTGQVTDSWADLCQRNLMAEDELLLVTDEGKRLAASFTQEVLEIEQNRVVLDTLEEIVEKYAALDTTDLLKQVYDMRCYTLDSPGKKHRVEAVRMTQEFTRLLEEEEAPQSLYIPPGWQVTLELTFDPDALRNLQRGIEDAQAGRVYGWEALGTDV